MNKEFIPYQESLELKELGFDEECFAMYMKDIFKSRCWCKNSEFGDKILFTSAPTFSQAFRWFREEGYVSYVEVLNTGKYDYMLISKNFTEVVDFNDGSFDTYEEAELGCLRQLIEIVKQQKSNHDLMSGDGN